jgi:hypothetical protein
MVMDLMSSDKDGTPGTRIDEYAAAYKTREDHRVGEVTEVEIRNMLARQEVDYGRGDARD